MAGRKHHFIPQFLQRGFATSRGNEWHAFAHFKDRAVGLNIRNFGAQRDFYGEPGDTEIDDAITSYEFKAASLINELRVQKSNVEISDDGIADLVSHLEMRSRASRLHMANFLSEVWQWAIETLTDQNQLAMLLRSVLHENPRLVEREVSKSLLTVEQKRRAVEQVNASLSPYMDFVIEDICRNLHQTLTSQPTQSEAKVKEIQLKNLRKDILNPKRSAIYSSLRYRIVDVKFDVFLPDCMIFFQYDREWTPIFLAPGQLRCILFPISNSRYVVGSQIGYDPKIKGAQPKLVSCCYEAFLSAKNTPTQRLLAKGIAGREGNAFRAARDELTQMFFNMFSGSEAQVPQA